MARYALIKKVMASCFCAGLLLLPIGQKAAAQEVITQARFGEMTDRYPHGVLGDRLEWGALEVVTENRQGDFSQKAVAITKTYRLLLPDNRVFEDIEPRLVDLDQDGAPEIVVVESDVTRGARLAIYDQSGVVAATPFIGTRFRWLAPIGAADLDGDGRTEIAYIDRPHLRKTLRIWRFARTEDGASLVEVARKTGLTNHRIGQAYITGGIRNCGAGHELVTADADWQSVVVTALKGSDPISRVVSRYDGGASVDAVLACQK